MFIMNGITWEIEFVRPGSKKLIRSDGTFTCGMCDGKNCVIYLSDLLSGEFLRHVFIHECTHAAMFSYSIFIPLEYEEFICSFVADHGDEIFDIVEDTFRFLRRVA